MGFRAIKKINGIDRSVKNVGASEYPWKVGFIKTSLVRAESIEL